MRKLYFELLGPVISVSTTIGLFAGIEKCLTRKQHTSITPFSDILGTTSLGAIIGITYPVSLPVLTGYVIFFDHNVSSKNDKDK